MSDFENVGAGWPPEGDEPTSMVAPLFPLPNVFLFPGQVLPLHIFEPRYRQMIQDVLDGPGRIVIAPIVSGDAGEARPEVLSLAGLGEIARFEKLPDGRFLVWLLGLSRVKIREIDSDRLYRRVEAEPFEEVAPPPDEAESLRIQLQQAIQARSAMGDKFADQTDVRILADVLAQLLELPTAEMSTVFSQARIAVRARQALDAHHRKPIEQGPDASDDVDDDPGPLA